MIVYKLFKSDMTTKGTKWKNGVTKVISKHHRQPLVLCSSSVFHAFSTPFQAANYRILYRIDRDFLWACETPKVVAREPDKIGVYELTPLYQLKTDRLQTIHGSEELMILHAKMMKIRKEKRLEFYRSWQAGNV